MSVRIRPGDEPAWQWAQDDDRVADPADVHSVFEPEAADDGSGAWFRRPERAASLFDRPDWRRGVAGVMFAAVVVLLLGGLAYRLSVPAPPSAETVVAPSSSPSAPSTATPSPTPTAEGVPAGTTALPWQGAALPVSDTAGPAVFTQNRSTGFSHDPQGAAFAAVHISTHLDPLTGPAVFTPTIDEQVLGAEELVAQTQQQYEKAARQHGLAPEAVADGAPVLAPTGNISDWRIGTYRADGITTVELLVAAPQGQQMIYEVPVIWQDGDWRITFENSNRGFAFRVTEAKDSNDFTPFITRGK